MNIDNTILRCVFCHYKTNKLSNYKRHMSSKNHNVKPKPNPPTDKIYICECGKAYPYRSSLYNHKRKCNIDTNEITILETDNNNNRVNDSVNNNVNDLCDMVKQLIQENNKFRNDIVEMSKNIPLI